MPSSNNFELLIIAHFIEPISLIYLWESVSFFKQDAGGVNTSFRKCEHSCSFS